MKNEINVNSGTSSASKTHHNGQPYITMCQKRGSMYGGMGGKTLTTKGNPFGKKKEKNN